MRHKAGQIARSDIFLDVLPVDDKTDPQLAEISKSLLTGILQDPMKQYHDIRDTVVLGALAARLWAYRMDFVPDIGPYGEIVFSAVDGRKIRWSAAYSSPHDPLCPWFYEVRRMDAEEAMDMRNWKNNSDLHGDVDTHGATTRNALQPGQIELDSSQAPSLLPSKERKYTTVVFLYERNKKSSRTIEKPGSFKKLAPQDQYMACTDGCGYKSPSMGDMQQQQDTMGTPPEMPPQAPQACPDCGGDLTRIDAVVSETNYSANNTLTIFAPYEGDEGEIFFQGPWPHGTRSIPYCVYTAYTHPTKPMGQSETSLNWTMMLATNMTLRIGLEHMLLAKPYWQIPTSATDYKQEPWMFGADQGLGIYVDPFAPQGSLQVLQAAGLPAAWSTLYGALDSGLRSDMGTNDITFDSSQSKDIPVGTIQTLERLGEIPVEHQIERLRRQESIAFSVLLDMIRATYTDARLVRMKNEEGQWMGMVLRGADLPCFDIIVTADPTTNKINEQDVENLLKVASQPPPIRKFLAKGLNIPISMVTELNQEMDAWEQQQAQQQMQMAQMQNKIETQSQIAQIAVKNRLAPSPSGKASATKNGASS